MYKIGIIDKMNIKGINLLNDYKDFECELVTDLSHQNLLSQIPKYDGIAIRRGKIDKEILDKSPKLKVIARHGVGYDSIDIKTLKEKNGTLLVTDDTTSTSPAEHIMFMILNISKSFKLFDQSVRKGNFDQIMHMEHMFCVLLVKKREGIKSEKS